MTIERTARVYRIRSSVVLRGRAHPLTRPLCLKDDSWLGPRFSIQLHLQNSHESENFEDVSLMNKAQYAEIVFQAKKVEWERIVLPDEYSYLPLS